MEEPDSLFERLRLLHAGRPLPPVDRWHPTRVGDSHMRISADGRWFHRGSEIRRPALVRLFSTILRRDPEGFALVTPAERLFVAVDDAPFLAVDCEARGVGTAQEIAVVTNVGDVVVIDGAHPLSVTRRTDGPRPYVRVRGGLDALVSRAAYYRLADLAEAIGHDTIGVRSRGTFFPLT